MNTINGWNHSNKSEISKQNINNLPHSQEMRDRLRGNSNSEREVGINSILANSRNYFEQLKANRQKADATNQKIKQLKYQFKEMSSRIIQSKTSTAARKAAGQARRELLRLKKEKFANKDDSAEMEAAINHAKAMERVAKKKAKHLEEEEMSKITGGPCNDALSFEDLEIDDILLTEEAIKEIIEESDLEENIEEFDQEVMEEMDPEDLKELKIKHRNKEMKEIVKADSEYLKTIFEGYEKAKSGTGGEIVQNALPVTSEVSQPTINITL